MVDGFYEIDQFDTSDTIYLIAADDQDEHAASIRLFPTSRPHMLDTLFPHLCPFGVPVPPIHRNLMALRAVDAREAGASLREIAELLLGPSDWPGDGERRKSRVRRMLSSGIGLIVDGPASILSNRGLI